MAVEKPPQLEKSLSNEDDLPSVMKVSLWAFIVVVLMVCTGFVINHYDFKRTQAVATASIPVPPPGVAPAPASPAPATTAAPVVASPPPASAETDLAALEPGVASSAPEQLALLRPQDAVEPAKPSRNRRAAAWPASISCPANLMNQLRPGCTTSFQTVVEIH